MTDETKKTDSSRTPRSQGPEWTREVAEEKELAWLRMVGRAVARARSNLLASTEAKARGKVFEPNAVLSREEQDARDTVRRVLMALFAEPGDNAKRLREAMETSRAETATVLTTLNVEEGAGPVDPDFNDYQYLGLDRFLFGEELTAISPVEAGAPNGNVLVKREVLRFWTELLSKQAGEVEDFHYKISDYAANRNDGAKLERVLAVLRQYAPGGQWQKKHADALTQINTESIEFKSLAWLHHPGVIW